VPAAIITELNVALGATLANQDVRGKLIKAGAEPQPSTPAELYVLMKKDTAKWAAIIKEKKIKAE
jgi:tripartite-type tricarboxylate transporter receptor subunit TctC